MNHDSWVTLWVMNQVTNFVTHHKASHDSCHQIWWLIHSLPALLRKLAQFFKFKEYRWWGNKRNFLGAPKLSEALGRNYLTRWICFRGCRAKKRPQKRRIEPETNGNGSFCMLWSGSAAVPSCPSLSLPPSVDRSALTLGPVRLQELEPRGTGFFCWFWGEGFWFWPFHHHYERHQHEVNFQISLYLMGQAVRQLIKGKELLWNRRF